MFELEKKINIITGHYGSGKTNLAVNLAMMLKKQGKKPVVVDLDIVNPYFRTADFAELFADNGIELIAPVYANTNLDLPALSGAVDGVFHRTDCDAVILDVGGDDAGAIALGRYAKVIDRIGYDLFYVINRYRYLTASPEESLDVMREIEAVSRLKATKLINNSNLGEITTAEDIRDSFEFAQQVARHANLPLWATAAVQDLAAQLEIPLLMAVELYVKLPFQPL